VEINAQCKNKDTALLILETVMETIKSDTQITALKAVSEWIRVNNTNDSFAKLSLEEQEAGILDLKISLRKCMSNSERIGEAIFYLEGLGGNKIKPVSSATEPKPELEPEYESEPTPEPITVKRGIGTKKQIFNLF
jgi:hypothetical protein